MMKIVTQKMLGAQGLRAIPPVAGDSRQGVHQLAPLRCGSCNQTRRDSRPRLSGL